MLAEISVEDNKAYRLSGANIFETVDINNLRTQLLFLASIGLSGQGETASVLKEFGEGFNREVFGFEGHFVFRQHDF